MIFVILANKCDEANALPLDKVIEKLDAATVSSNRSAPTRIQRCSGVTGEGAEELMDWLCKEHWKLSDAERDKMHC